MDRLELLTIDQEQPKHLRACETLLDRAFGQNRHLRIISRMRRGIRPIETLCFVAITKQPTVFINSMPIVGMLRFYSLRANSVPVNDICFFGPLAIEPHYHGLGVGTKLCLHGIQQVRDQGFKAILIVGDQLYYKRFGFKPITHLNVAGDITPLTLMGMAFGNNDKIFKTLSQYIAID